MERPYHLSVLLLIAIQSGCGAELPFDRGGGTSSVEESSFATPSWGTLKILCLDVGQGDATLIITPNKEALLIDAGPQATGPQAVLNAMQREETEELTAVIASHYHEDHIGGIPAVVAGNDGVMGTADDHRPRLGFFDRGDDHEPETEEWRAYKELANGGRHRLSAGDRLNVGDVTVEVLAATGRLADGETIDITPFDENAESLALVVSFENFRFFVAGDLTGGGGNPPYQTVDIETPLAPLVDDIDVLRVSHHGSHTSTNSAFLAATTPEVAIISVGDGNDYFHPHASILDRLMASNIAVYQTERGWAEEGIHGERHTIANGDIMIEVDKEGYEISTVPANR